MEPSQSPLPCSTHWWEGKQGEQGGAENTCQPPLDWYWGLPTKINKYSVSSRQSYSPATKHFRLQVKVFAPKQMISIASLRRNIHFALFKSVCKRKEKRKPLWKILTYITFLEFHPPLFVSCSVATSLLWHGAIALRKVRSWYTTVMLGAKSLPQCILAYS